jgi:hypothetical protein
MVSPHKPAWDALFAEYAARRENQLLRAEQRRAAAAWYEDQTRLIMDLVREVALERAQLFQRQTNTRVEVRAPSRPPINLTPEGPFMSFLSLALGAREVHMYSHRIGDDPPTLHYVVTGRPMREHGHRRVLGRPGCRVERRPGGGFLLRDLTPPPEHLANELNIEDLTFRAFEALLTEGPPDSP